MPITFSYFLLDNVLKLSYIIVMKISTIIGSQMKTLLTAVMVLFVILVVAVLSMGLSGCTENPVDVQTYVVSNTVTVTPTPLVHVSKLHEIRYVWSVSPSVNNQNISGMVAYTTNNGRSIDTLVLRSNKRTSKIIHTVKSGTYLFTVGLTRIPTENYPLLYVTASIYVDGMLIESKTLHTNKNDRYIDNQSISVTISATL